MQEITIGNTLISKDKLHKPYVISEIGVNHEGDMEKAKLMIKQSKEAGANAVKFQAYKADKLASKNSPAYWDITKEPTKNQRELFKKYDKFWKREYEELYNYCKELDIDFLCTPFDEEAVDFLKEMVPAFKIASADITNYPLLRKVAKVGKPVIISTGASTISEIWKAIEVVEEEGNSQIILLHCVLNYPTKYENANLGRIARMNKIFQDYLVGYSDHTLAEKSDIVLLTAWLLGAKVIEKHFTFDKTLPGNDHYHAMDVRDLERITKLFEFVYTLYETGDSKYLESEIVARQNARRRIVAKRDIKMGEVLSQENITLKRAAEGIPAEFYDYVIGKRTTRDIEEDEIVFFGDISDRL